MSKCPFEVAHGLTTARTMIGRRPLLSWLTASGLTAVTARSAAAASTAVNLFIWTGAQEPVPRRIAEAYAKAHPDINIAITAGTNAETFPKIKASLDIDLNQPLVNLGFFNMDATARGRLSKMWVPLTPDLVPNVANILPAYRQPNDTGAFFCMDVVGIVYNTQKIRTPPTSWNDILKPEYKGRVAAYDGFFPGNGLVALAKIHGGGEDNIEPGMALFEKAAKDGQFHSLYTSNAQVLQLLGSGEVWIVPYLRGIVLPAKAQGAPIDYAVPKEGQLAFPEGFQIVRGSSKPQVVTSADLLNQMLAPDVVLDYCVTAAVVPLLKDLKLPPALMNDPAVQPEAMANAIQLDYAKIAVNTPAWTAQWNRRVKANLR